MDCTHLDLTKLKGILGLYVKTLDYKFINGEEHVCSEEHGYCLPRRAIRTEDDLEMFAEGYCEHEDMTNYPK